jgi:multifunctional methyltransferase subunit TRM112
MKLLTVNFLTCAVKSCKSSLSFSSTTNKESSNDPTDALSPFPLHFRDAVLERTEINYNPRFIQNILLRLNWEALSITASELGLLALLPEKNPLDDPRWIAHNDTEAGGEHNGSATGHIASQDGKDEKMEVEGDATIREDTQQEDDGDEKDKVLRQLHTLLLETSVSEGKLACGKCGFEYPIKEGVGNFLLPAHLGEWLPILFSLPCYLPFPGYLAYGSQQNGVRTGGLCRRWLVRA